MKEYPREYFLSIPADACPFCGPGMMESGWDYVPAEPSEYYYRCGCGAGEDVRAYPDGHDSDEDGSNPVTMWIIEESQIDDVREEYKEWLQLIGEDDE